MDKTTFDTTTNGGIDTSGIMPMSSNETSGVGCFNGFEIEQILSVQLSIGYDVDYLGNCNFSDNPCFHECGGACMV